MQAFYLILKYYVTVAIHFYYRQIKVVGKEKLKGSGPFLFVANHQNAFMDGVLVGAINSSPVHFLIRADIFKKTWAAALLKSLKLLPVYRMRDGFSSLNKNQKQFDECVQIFLKRESVLIFPEGNHSDTRRLRPMSKGFTRIAFEAQKHSNLNLKVVPVGINYSNHHAFNARVSIHYGDPIPVSDYFMEPLAASAALFKERIEKEIGSLIANVQDENRYAEIVSKLNASGTDFFNPHEANERIKKIMQGESVTQGSQPISLYYKLFTPLRPIARLINLPVEIGWRKFSRTIKDSAFITSLKFGYGISVVQSYYLTIMAIASIWLGWWVFALYPLLLGSLKILRRPL